MHTFHRIRTIDSPCKFRCHVIWHSGTAVRSQQIFSLTKVIHGLTESTSVCTHCKDCSFLSGFTITLLFDCHLLCICLFVQNKVMTMITRLSLNYTACRSNLSGTAFVRKKISSVTVRIIVCNRIESAHWQQKHGGAGLSDTDLCHTLWPQPRRQFPLLWPQGCPLLLHYLLDDGWGPGAA